MGLDGGTIASRSDVLRRSSWRLASRDTAHRSTRGGQLASDFTAAQAEERVSETERREAAWSSCALTGAPLEGTTVACSLGLLYKKESVVQFLLSLAGVEGEGDDKWVFMRLKQLKSQFSHITSRKDVFEVRFHSEAKPSGDAEGGATLKDTRDQQGNESSPGSANGQIKDSRWICPVTGLRLDGPHTSCALRTCGHVISERALRQIKGSVCPVCSKPYSEEEVVRLNRPPGEVEELRLKLKRKKEERERSKQEHKRKRVKGEASCT